MTLDELTRTAINPALAWLPAKMGSTLARLEMLAIALQESEIKVRYQVLNGGGKGPARSFWQMEKWGGVNGVLRHPSTTDLAHACCEWREVSPEPGAIWQALERDDVLGAVWARLLLYTDHRPLPQADDVAGAWDYYERNWQPGKPHPEKWPGYHAQARAFLGA